jgi:ATP-dependent Clp protease protease subunit
MKKKPWTMQAKAGVGEIFLYDEIGGGFFSEGITAKTFNEDLKALGDVATLNIFINSPGGSVFEGVTIYNILDRHRARKVVSIDGLAASIASVIGLVGDERSIAANAVIMIHDPWSVAVGSAEDMRRTADTLDKIRTTLLDTYVRQTTTDEDRISAMMSEETWLNAEEALSLGFVDTIGAQIEIAAKFDLSKFKHPPAPLVEAMAAVPDSPEQPAADTPADPPPADRPEANPLLLKARQGIKRRGIKDRRADPAPTAA